MAAYAVISGNLGKDPELRFTTAGTPVVNLSIANNRAVKVGEKYESIADWWKVTIFGRNAEILAQYAKKGTAVSFNGELQNEKYTDREGIQRVSTILKASSFEFIRSGKRERNGEDETVGENITSEPGVDPDEVIPF